MYLPYIAALISTTAIYLPKVDKRDISTIHKIDVLTTVTTITRYTSTKTITIWPDSLNSASVVDSSHASANTPSSISLAPIESISSGTSAEAAPTTSPAADTTPKTSTAESKPASSENIALLPSSTSLKAIFVSSTSLTPSPTSAPATTAAPSPSSTKAPSSQRPDSESDLDWGSKFPSSTDGYLLAAVLTHISNSVCVVHHYYTPDSTTTTTVTVYKSTYSTSTLV